MNSIKGLLCDDCDMPLDEYGNCAECDALLDEIERHSNEQDMSDEIFTDQEAESA